MKLNVEIEEFKYKDKIIFLHSSLELLSNNIYVLKGNNGSGKTTLLNIISGFYIKNCKLKLNDQIISNKNNDSYFDNYISYMPQKPFVFEELTCIENILFPYINKDENKAIDILKNLKLEDLAYKKANNLSYGEKQRLCFARLIYSPKKILLLDEICANLDAENKQIIINYLYTIKKNSIVIFSNNDESIKINDCINLIIKNNEITADRKNNLSFTNVENKINLNRNNIFKDMLKQFKLQKLFIVFFSIFTTLILSLSVVFNILPSENLNDKFDDIAYKMYLKDSPTYLINENLCKNIDEIPKNELMPLYIPDIYGALALGNNVDADYILKPGRVTCGYIQYSTSLNLEIIEGRKPLNPYEIVISDLNYQTVNQISGKTINDDIILDFLPTAKFKVVGVYKSVDNNEFVTRFSQANHDNMLGDGIILRTSYAFKIETLFGFSKVSDFLIDPSNYLILNKKENEKFINKEYFKNYSSFFAPYYSKYPIIVDKNGYDIPEKYSNLRTFFFTKYYMYLLVSLILVSLISFSVLFILYNRKSMILLRYSSYSKKRLILGNLLLYSLIILIIDIFTLLLSMLGIYLINIIFNNVILNSNYIYFTYNYIYYLINIPFSLMFILAFVILIYKIIFKKNKKEEIEDLKQ